MTDRSRYLVAGALLLIVFRWLAVDIVHGDWSRVLVRGIFAVALVALILTVARLRGRS